MTRWRSQNDGLWDYTRAKCKAGNAAICTSDNDCVGNTHCLVVTIVSPGPVPFGLCL